MPFTFSHPAIVLPGYYLPQRWRSLTGLIAGSVAPDFEMFLRMKALNAFSHSWHSMFWFSLPLGIVLTSVFHLVVRNPLIQHLPLFLRWRLGNFKSIDWTSHFRQHTFVVTASLLLGIASHLFWDNFTHQYGLFVKWFPILAKEVNFGAYRLPVFFLLQILFSIIGGLVVLYAVLQLPAKHVPMPSQHMFRYWLLVITVTLLLTVIRFTTGLNFTHFPNVIVVIISAGLAGLLLASCLIRDRYTNIT